MREDSKHSDNHMHWHDGTTCHGAPTLKECVDGAIKSALLGKVLEITDQRRGEVVRCYSMIVGSFDHHAKHGRFVAETKLVAVGLETGMLL